MNVSIKKTKKLMNYERSIVEMSDEVCAVKRGTSSGLLWFLEYPPLFTQGRSAKGELLMAPFPVHKTGRGGKTTYHGPGQRIIYFIHALPIQDLKKYIHFLESWIIKALAVCGVEGGRSAKGVGVWVQKDNILYKVAAIGVRMEGWVTSHGIAINVNPDLRHYEYIDPCGLKNTEVTSLYDLGYYVPMANLDQAFLDVFETTYQDTMAS